MDDCAEQVNEHTCQWTTKSEPIYNLGFERFLFKLVSNNSLGTAINYFNISHYDIIEPGMPQNFEFKKLNATFVHLKWTLPEHFDYNSLFPPKLHYQLEIERYSPQNVLTAPKQTLIFNLYNNYSFDYNNLLPYSEYRFKLRCYVSIATKKPNWSVASNLTLQTPSDIPYHCPVFYNSSFESSTTVTGDRSITVYWKPVDLQFSNAPNLQYRIEYGQVDSSQSLRLIDKMFEVPITNHSVTFYTFEQMLTNSSYMFRIRSVNDQGVSKCSSQLYIDKLANQPAKPMDLTVSFLGDGKYELKWKHSRPNQVKQFNIYWCPNVRPRPFPCLGVLHSISVPNHDQSEHANHSFRYLLDNLDDKLNYQFSVSADSETSSSGISWASCIIPRQIEKLEKINDFRAVAISPYAIDLSWKLQCSALSELIKKFEITYCDVEDKNMNQCNLNRKLIVDGGDQERTHLKDLQPNSLYRISIRALTNNTVSEENTAVVRTFNGPPAKPSRLIHHQSSARSVTLHWAGTVGPKESIDFFEISYGNTKKKFAWEKVCTQNFDGREHGFRYECSANLIENVLPSHTYQMELKGCITNNFMGELRQICSPGTLVTVKTDLEAPGVVRKPYIKMVNKTHALIEWPYPEQPNGENNHFILRIYSSKNEWREQKVFSNMTEFKIDCTAKSGSLEKDKNGNPINYPMFSVAAVNLKNQTELIGEFSEQTSVNFCEQITHGIIHSKLIVLTVTVAIVILSSVLIFYILFKWCLNKVNYIKRMRIAIPTGLEDPCLEFEDEKRDANKLLNSGKNADELKQSSSRLNRWTSWYFFTNLSKISKLPKKQKIEGFARRIFTTNDASYYEKQRIDQIDMKTCTTTDYEGMSSSSHISGSLNSSLSGETTEEIRVDEQKPLLISIRENDINSSGSDDSGVDVRGGNCNFKTKSIDLDSIDEKRYFFSNRPALNTDLLVFQSISTSVPSICDKKLKSSDPTKLQAYYANLVTNSKSNSNLNAIEFPIVDCSLLKDIHLPSFQILSEPQTSSAEEANAEVNSIASKDNHFLLNNIKSTSLSLLDFRDLKSVTNDSSPLVNILTTTNCLSTSDSTSMLFDSPFVPPPDDIVCHSLTKCEQPQFDIDNPDYVAFSGKPPTYDSCSVSLNGSIDHDLKIDFNLESSLNQFENKSILNASSCKFTSPDKQNQTDSSDFELAPINQSPVIENNSVVPLDSFVFEIDPPAFLSDHNLNNFNEDPNCASDFDSPLGSYDSSCEQLADQSRKKQGHVRSDYVPIDEMTKYS